jgi:hypothetical protein
MVQPQQGGEASAGLGTQIEVHERQVPYQAATQLLVQLVDRGRHRKVASECLLEVRPLTGYVVNQQYANHVLPLTPIALALGVRASRVESAYFVLARRRKACLLAPPQHGGARFPTLTPRDQLSTLDHLWN